MKTYYQVGGDLFLVAAFVVFTIGGVLRLFDLAGLAMNLLIFNARHLLNFAKMCLGFSIALSLLDIAHKGS